MAVIILCFLTVPWVVLQSEIVAFSGLIHLIFDQMMIDLDIVKFFITWMNF